MNHLFLSIVNMSLTASIIGAAVLALRAVFKRKLPRWLFCLLWAVVLVRLLVPFSFSSPVSAFNAFPGAAARSEDGKTGTISFIGDTGAAVRFPTLQSPAVGSKNTPETQSAAPNRPTEGAMMQDPGLAKEEAVPGALQIVPAQISVTTILACIWLSGLGLLLLYSAGCYLYTMRKIHASRRLSHTEQIDAVFLKIGVAPSRVELYQSSLFASPVVCGLIRPKLVLSDLVTQEDLSHVIAHELTHIRRHDNLFKALATLALYIHWFNPLIWLFYHWYVTDMETSCDEAVVSRGDAERRAYAYSLVNMAEKSRSAFAGGFLAFGECALKERVRSIMNVRKNTMILSIIGLSVVTGLAVVFLTNPQSPPAVLPDTPAAQEPQTGDSQALLEWEGAQESLRALTPESLEEIRIEGYEIEAQDFETLVSAVKQFELSPWDGMQKPGADAVEFVRKDGPSLMLTYSGDRLLIAEYGRTALDDRSYICRVNPESLSNLRAFLMTLPADTPPADMFPFPSPAAPMDGRSPALPDASPEPSSSGEDAKADADEKETEDQADASSEEETDAPSSSELQLPLLRKANPPCLRIPYDEVMDVTLVDWESHTACPITDEETQLKILSLVNKMRPQDGLGLTPDPNGLRLLQIRLTDGTKYDYWCHSNVMIVGNSQLADSTQLRSLYNTFYQIEQTAYGEKKVVPEWLGYMNPYRITSLSIEKYRYDRLKSSAAYTATASGEERDAILEVAAQLKALTVHPKSTQSVAKEKIAAPADEELFYVLRLNFESGYESYTIYVMESGWMMISVGSMDYGLIYSTINDGMLDSLIDVLQQFSE